MKKSHSFAASQQGHDPHSDDKSAQAKWNAPRQLHAGIVTQGEYRAGKWPLMVGLAIAFTLVALTLLYGNLVEDYRGVQWLSWLQIVGNGILAAVMWWLMVKFTARS